MPDDTTDDVPWLFDDATTVRPGAVEGDWDVDLRDEFTIVNGHPNGGYLLALLGRAAVAAVGQEDRHVVGATATYVSPPTTGPAVVRTEVLRRGRTASQVRAALVQDDKVTVDVVMTVAALSADPPAWGEIAPVEMPDEATCRADSRTGRSAIVGLPEPPLAKVMRVSFDPEVLSFLSGEPSGRGELRAWLSLADGRPWDPLALLFAVDALPPATFEVAMTGWVPTLSLTAYVRALPAPGPLRIRFRANVIAGGFVDETADVWDATGRLVAQSTQLAAIRL
ncbi:thioesterase family protein [Iamia sp. SCSIO 61187]|uniref:thioesterase family protein n=1 Tax=Iamia sp. SCSIO 61187 TaxID=2722752 RepID=UPI001C62BB96|nr:thioesterase family protein [Iamia sp. SCSIO 61187]QYG93588.1 thioesterase family protein [Iamia sp. SCSIO 61187]